MMEISENHKPDGDQKQIKRRQLHSARQPKCLRARFYVGGGGGGENGFLQAFLRNWHGLAWKTDTLSRRAPMEREIIRIHYSIAGMETQAFAES